MFLDIRLGCLKSLEATNALAFCNSLLPTSMASKLECFSSASLFRIIKCNTLAYLHIHKLQKIKCFECSPKDCILNTSFPLWIKNGPNMLSCCTTLGWNSLPGTNTTTYWAHSKVIKKMKCCERKPWWHLFGISCVTTDNFCFYLKNRLIQTSQTGGQQYNDTSPFSIPCLMLWILPQGVFRFKLKWNFVKFWHWKI